MKQGWVVEGLHRGQKYHRQNVSRKARGFSGARGENWDRPDIRNIYYKERQPLRSR